jgi:hypothetical protein
MCSHFPLLRLINNKYSCTSLSVYVVKDINTNSSSYPFEIVLPYKDRNRSIRLEALREKSNRNSEKTFLLWKHRELELKTDDRGCGGLSFVSRKGIAWRPKCCPCTETSFLILIRYSVPFASNNTKALAYSQKRQRRTDFLFGVVRRGPRNMQMIWISCILAIFPRMILNLWKNLKVHERS